MIGALVAYPATQAKVETFEEKIPGHLPVIKMAKLPGGTVEIDGEKIEIKPFAIGVTELHWDIYDIFFLRLDLTQAEAATDAVIKARPSKPYGAPDRGFGHKGFAALGMTSQSAIVFCEWLSKKTGKKYRLPTEAEWEYAARAGAKEMPKPIDDYAWHWDNADDVAHKTGSKKPNAWGLFDTFGNAAEWSIAADGTPVVKGGHFYNKPDEFSFGMREKYDPAWQESDAQIPKSKWWLSNGEMIGMRVVCELP